MHSFLLTLFGWTYKSRSGLFFQYGPFDILEIAVCDVIMQMAYCQEVLITKIYSTKQSVSVELHYMYIYRRSGQDSYTDLNSTTMLSSNEQEKYLSGQDRAVRLDAFTLKSFR